ncbi:MAG TPA: glycosyltransferase [Candidatus Bathyarchaeia archaeon]|nr:glycosyltransferase [Candidatus Bathyarchaeia archaeon]
MSGQPAVLVYADTLGAPSETFVTGLIDCVSSIGRPLLVVTHGISPAGLAGKRVTVLPRYPCRWTPAWLVNLALRTLGGRELFEGALRRLLARSSFDVVHAQFGQPGYLVCRALPRRRQRAARLVVNFYGYDATGLPESVPQWRRRYAELFRYPNLAVVVEGPAMKARLAGLGCPEDRIHVVPLCLAEPAGGWPQVSPSRDPHVLGFVGRFVEKKGFAFALRALAPILTARPDVRVVMIGDGPERPLLERLIAAHGLAGRVRLPGMRPHAEVLSEIARMGALVVPSLTAHDGDSEGGAPTIVAEAQLVGIPVIASDHADIPVSLCDHSFLFKEGDARSLVEAVERYLAHGGDLYDAARARRCTQERHDRRRLRERYAAIYRGGHGG